MTERDDELRKKMDELRSLAIKGSKAAIETLREVAAQTDDPKSAKKAAAELKKLGLDA